jgi:hypothetical protein
MGGAAQGYAQGPRRQARGGIESRGMQADGRRFRARALRPRNGSCAPEPARCRDAAAPDSSRPPPPVTGGISALEADEATSASLSAYAFTGRAQQA